MRGVGARTRGFTLIEVLVALAIVTIGMAALLGTVNSAAGTTTYLQDKTFAEWIALNQVSTVRLQLQAPSQGNSTGEVDFAGRKWKWSQDVSQMQVPGILRVDVKVRPSDIKASDNDAWYASVSGVVGDAVAAPRGDLPTWSTTPAAATAPTGAPTLPRQSTLPQTPTSQTPTPIPAPTPAPTPAPGGL